MRNDSAEPPFELPQRPPYCSLPGHLRIDRGTRKRPHPPTIHSVLPTQFLHSPPTTSAPYLRSSGYLHRRVASFDKLLVVGLRRARPAGLDLRPLWFVSINAPRYASVVFRGLADVATPAPLPLFREQLSRLFHRLRRCPPQLATARRCSHPRPVMPQLAHSRQHPQPPASRS